MSTTLVSINDKSVQSIASYPLFTLPVVILDKQDIYSMEEYQIVSITASGILQTEVVFMNGDFPETMEHEDIMSNTIVNITATGHSSESYPITTVFVSVTGELETPGEAENTHRISGVITNNSKIIILDKLTNELVTTKNVVAGYYEVDIPDIVVDVIAKKADGEMLAKGDVVPREI